jgi:hypothetical protein
MNDERFCDVELAMNSNGHESNGKAAGGARAGDAEIEIESEGEFDKGTRDTIAAMLGIGCDLSTAARVVGRSPAEVKALLGEDKTFLRDVEKYGSLFEGKHLKHLDKAAEDKKNYRVSMWLLERLRPDKYEKQRPRTIKESQLMPLLKSMAEMLVDGVEDEAAREALFDRVMATANALNPNGTLGQNDET